MGLEDKYRTTTESHGIFRFILKFLLKIMWSVGGEMDGVDGLPRVRGIDIQPSLPKFQRGDFLLLGNNGGLSHIMVYVDEDIAIHSMATEKTMRGKVGSLWDAIRRPFWWTFGLREQTGVIKESITGFLNRYERDTWVLLRREGLSAEQVNAGISHIETLVGAAYDYDFNAGDDDYYCTEIVVEFLEAAGVPEVFPTRHIRIPMILDAHVIEPISVLAAEAVQPVLANAAATEKFAAEVEKAEIVVG